MSWIELVIILICSLVGCEAPVNPVLNERGKIIIGTGNGIYFLTMDGRYLKVFGQIQKQVSRKNYPTFSPNGSHVAYCEYDNDINKIIVYDLKKKSKIVLFSDTDSITNLSWSPDGKKLLFLTNYKYDSESLDLCTIDITSRKRRRVVDDFVNAIDLSTPSWSPDGRMILFSGVNNKVMEVNLDNKLLKELFDGICPSYSPNGKYIAYRKGKNEYIRTDKGTKYLISGYKYYIYDVKNNSDWFLFNGDEKPSSGSSVRNALVWSPNSKYILFSKSYDMPFREKVYLINISSKKRTFFAEGFAHTPGAISWTGCFFETNND